MTMHLKTLFHEGPRRHLAVCLLLFMTVLLLFARTGTYEFLNYDDDDYVYENEFVREGLTLSGLKWAVTATLHDHWHPLTWISHMIDCQIFGLDPGGAHVVNVLLHALNTLILFLALRGMTGRYWSSLAVAVLFAIHPMNVQSVAWISERKNLLSTLFAFLSLHCYAIYAQKRSIAHYVSALVLFLLGLLSKSMLVTQPFLMLLLDFWPLGRVRAFPCGLENPAPPAGWRRLILEKIPFLAASVAISIVTLSSRGHRLEGVSTTAPSLLERLGEALPVYTAYLAKLVRPVDLAILYPPTPSAESWLVTLAALVLATLTIAALRRIKDAPWLAMGWAWFQVSITPVIGVVQAGPQLMADRYAYLTYIGLFIALVWTLADFVKNNPERVRYVLVACAVAASLLLVQTWLEISTWRNSLTVFEATIRNTKNNSKAHVNLGLALLKSGKAPEAIRHFETATRINAKDYIAHFNLGNFHLTNRRYQAAENHFRKSIVGNPKYEKAYANLGTTLIHLKRFDEAVGVLNEALKINPLSARAVFNLGLAYELSNRKTEAIAAYQRTLDLAPDHPQARERLKRISGIIRVPGLTQRKIMEK
jgi:tetratricopeptide (TPR) repeat protein